MVSSAGTGSAFASVQALRRNFQNSTIITSDTNPAHLVTSSLFSEKHLVCPPVSSDIFSDYLSRVVSEYEVDTVVLFIDTEVLIAAELYTAGSIAGTTALQVKDPALAAICADKIKTYLFLKGKGLPTPRTSTLDNPFDAAEYLLKPKRGFGSQVRIVTSKELSGVDFENNLIQEVCETPEVTIDVCHSQEYDFFKFICRERIQTKSGVCTKARLFLDDSLGELAKTLSIELGLHSFCFQVMQLRGSWVITDINPRLGAGTSICTVAGADFFSGMFANLWGLDPSVYFRDIPDSCYVTRQYTEYLHQ